MIRIEHNLETGESSEVTLTAEEISVYFPPVCQQIPVYVSMRQARLTLLANGLLDTVEQAIKGMDRAPQIEWEFASEVRRDSPLISGLAALLGLSSAQLDSMFIQAAAM